MQLNGTSDASRPGHEDEVLVLAPHAVRRSGRRASRTGRAAEPADEVEVVGREVLDDAHVAHAVGERADALGRDEDRLADLVAPLAQREQRGVEALDVPDGGVDARPRAPRR